MHTSQSKTSMKTLSPKKPSYGKKDDDDEDYDDQYPAPILKLKNDDGSWEEEDNRSNKSSIFDKESSMTRETAFISSDGNSAARGRSRKSMRENPNRRGSYSPNNSINSSKQFSRAEDVKDNDIPIFEFTAGEEFKHFDDDKKGKRGKKHNKKKSEEGEETNEDGSDKEQSSPSPNGRSGSRKRSQKSFRGEIPKVKVKKISKQEALRTDKNEKAKYMKLPAGKFRREFSLDHPLAPNGKGKYHQELQQGLKPVGIFINPIKRNNEDIEETIKLSEKMEKLTYEAQTSVLNKTITGVNDEKSINDHLENLKKELNQNLENLLNEERIAEEERLQTISKIIDPQEKYNLELIFAEERQRASEKIIQATKENENTLKQAVLKTMNLGNHLQTLQA